MSKHRMVNGRLLQMNKRYKQLKTGQTLSSGARVVAVKISGTFIVLGAI